MEKTKTDIKTEVKLAYKHALIRCMKEQEAMTADLPLATAELYEIENKRQAKRLLSYLGYNGILYTVTDYNREDIHNHAKSGI